MSNVRSAPWAYLSWSNGTPAIVAGDGMSAPTSPATGRQQLNFPNTVSGGIFVIGSAGASPWRVVPLNINGLVEVQDSAGAAVNFNATTGFAFIQTRVLEVV